MPQPAHLVQQAALHYQKVANVIDGSHQVIVPVRLEVAAAGFPGLTDDVLVTVEQSQFRLAVQRSNRFIQRIRRELEEAQARVEENRNVVGEISDQYSGSVAFLSFGYGWHNPNGQILRHTMDAEGRVLIDVNASGDTVYVLDEGTGISLPQMTSADDAEIKGVELEVMWLPRTGGLPSSVVFGEYTNIAVFSNGSRNIEANRIDTTYIYNNPSTPLGTTEQNLGSTLFRSLGITTLPPSRKGEMNMVHDPIDYTSEARKAWTYIPGTRRVRQAPNLGFDTPNGPGGLMTVDDNQGFNGAFEKYEWKLVGKKEIYIPYHNYKLDEPGLDYETLLQVGHINPDYMRWELHRVWVVEATLKPGERHLYGKRVFYIDEDHLSIAAIDNYDNRGEIYRAGLIPNVYNFSVQGYVTRHNIFYDLQSGHYVVLRLTNSTGTPLYIAEPKNPEFYTPSNLRRMGRR